MPWLNVALKIFPLVVNAIQAVEKLAGAKKGKEKQDAAIELIGDFIDNAQLSFGKELMDVPEFQTLMRKLIDDYVAVQNFVAAFKAKQE